MSDLSVSIVIYRSDPVVLSRAIASLAAASAHLRSHRGLAAPVSLTLIDNGAAQADREVDVPAQWPDLSIVVRAGHGNVGYGAGHNLAIDAVGSRYHLILNPDVEFAPDALSQALDFLDRHPDVVALSPRIEGGDGQLQYLCRRYPSVADLFIRGFLPKALRRFFDARLARYEMRSAIDEQEAAHDDGVALPLLSPPIISGCFMLFRTEALQRLGGFDRRYFLYFEDYDLSLRAASVGRLAYVPQVRIVHYGGGASRKGFAHMRMFIRSAAQFYNRFGWRWW